MVAVRYHGWWPGPNDPFYQYNPSENGARINYYSQNAVPNLHIDGIIDAGSQEQNWWSEIQNRSFVESPLEISLGGEFNDATGEGSLDIDITATAIIEDINIRVRIALTESEIFYNAPNGLQWHNQTMRDIIPYPYGIPINIEFEQTISLNEPFSCPEPLVSDNCDLVIWVQSDATAEVLQAATIKLNQLTSTDIEEKNMELPEKSALRQNYPNPFNARTTISYDLSRRQLVSLNIYDIRGRLITTLVNTTQDPGTHTVILDSSELATGIYLYRLQADGIDITRTMSLIK